MTKNKLLERYPFYSLDSTTPLVTAKFGYVIVKSSGINPNRFLINKATAVEQKLIQVRDERLKRLENAIIEFKRLEHYYTELWKARGITWAPNPWE